MNGERAMILDLPYIHRPILTGSMKDDVVNLLTENGKEETAVHCVKVAETCAALAERFQLDSEAAYHSGILHDISGVIKPPDMLEYAEQNGWYIDKSERKYPFILHQRISSVVAGEYFGVTDERILSSIQCHSTLKAGASEYDMLLFLSDKISWDQQGVPPFLCAVQNALTVSLAAASLAYINFVLDHDMILLPHKWLLEAKLWLEEGGRI
jgi:predicted HD superfamily hydrolase involved in NAD metabolism